MFRKVGVPVNFYINTIIDIELKGEKILGLVINSAYYRCPSCSEKHMIFGPLDSSRRAVEELGSELLGEVPMVSEVSTFGDQGRLGEVFRGDGVVGGLENVRSVMQNVAKRVWKGLI
jgi:ATP-binding protein involved in chromosome partitioning